MESSHFLDVENNTGLRFGFGMKFSKISQIQDYVDFILASDFWKKRCKVKKIDIMSFKHPDVKEYIKNHGLENGYAVYIHFIYPLDNKDQFVISFNLKRRCSKSQIVILHELAHVLAEWDAKRLNYEDRHGKKFIEAYIDLIREFMPGEEKRISVLTAELLTRS